MAEHDSVPQISVKVDRDIGPSGQVLTNQVADTPLIQEQQRASDGFGLPGRRLEGCIPTPPHKRAKKSYIWQADIGLAVTEVKSGKKFWLCRHCYDNPVPQPLYLVETDSTTPAIRHLQSRHNYDEKGRRHDTAGQKRKRDAEDIRDAVKRLRDEKEKPFDTAGWKRAYLRWIVSDNQSLRGATSPALRALLGVDNSRIDAILPASHATSSSLHCRVLRVIQDESDEGLGQSQKLDIRQL